MRKDELVALRSRWKSLSKAHSRSSRCFRFDSPEPFKNGSRRTDRWATACLVTFPSKALFFRSDRFDGYASVGVYSYWFGGEMSSVSSCTWMGCGTSDRDCFNIRIGFSVRYAWAATTENNDGSSTTDARTFPRRFTTTSCAKICHEQSSRINDDDVRVRSWQEKESILRLILV